MITKEEQLILVDVKNIIQILILKKSQAWPLSSAARTLAFIPDPNLVTNSIHISQTT